MKPRNIAAHFVAMIGGAIVLTEVARYWLYGHRMEGGIIAIGAAFGFVGSYMADRRGALEGGGFLVDSFARVIQVVRTGRRSSDVAVVVPEKPKEDTNADL